MISDVVDTATANHYQWGESCDAWIFVDTEGLSVKLESMPDGTKEKLHFHAKASQFFYVLKGIASFYLEDNLVTVQEKKGLFIQPGARHFVANESGNLLEFLVVSQPSTNDDRNTIDQ